MSKEKMNELDLFRYELAVDGVSGEDFASSIGMGYASYKNVVRDGSSVVPKWVLAFLIGRGYVRGEEVLVEKKSDASHQEILPSHCADTTADNVASVVYDVSDVHIHSANPVGADFILNVLTR